MRDLHRRAALVVVAGAWVALVAALIVGDGGHAPRPSASRAEAAVQPDVALNSPAPDGNTPAPRVPNNAAPPTVSTSPTPTGVATASGAPIQAYSAAAPPTVTCVDDTTVDTAKLSRAIASPPHNGVVTIGPGTCALNSSLPLHSPITIEGAGQQATFIVQHAAENIFQVTSPYVTVEDLNLDTEKFNAGFFAQGTGGSPAVLFSAQSHTSVINVIATVGDGFGMRITGPNPCDTYQTTGTVVNNLTISNSGNGGRAALDIDCTNGAQISNVTIPTGNYIALYQDRNVTLTNETYTPWSSPCHEPWYVTGPALNITIDSVTGGGRGIIAGPASHIVVTRQSASPGC